jgi:hypothetical protein
MQEDKVHQEMGTYRSSQGGLGELAYVKGFRALEL